MNRTEIEVLGETEINYIEYPKDPMIDFVKGSLISY
jgi:hypothetical protein